MSGLLEFITRLCDQGEILLRERPHVDSAGHDQVLEYLSSYHADVGLEIAGPSLAFEPAIALEAAVLTWWASWFLVSQDDPPVQVEEKIRIAAAPGSGSGHLSADLTLRYLAQLHRRANARSAGDVLSRELAAVLRRWPLSGVLSDVTEGPLTPVLFDGHSGLLMLYAERWKEKPKPLWRGEGLAAEYCGWFAEGKA